jgi:azurin
VSPLGVTQQLILNFEKNNFTMKKAFLPLAFVALIAVACGGGENESAPEEAAATEEKTTDQAPAEEAVPAVAEIVIEGNDQMKYNLDRIDVKEGQKVRLTLKHVGELPKEAMGHNWVLVKPGTDKEAFASAAMEAKDNDYIPEAYVDNIIVHTKMIGGGEETTIEFDAPAKGFYSFFCSFPGHYVMMKGTFYVN